MRCNLEQGDNRRTPRWSRKASQPRSKPTPRVGLRLPCWLPKPRAPKPVAMPTPEKTCRGGGSTMTPTSSTATSVPCTNMAMVAMTSWLSQSPPAISPRYVAEVRRRQGPYPLRAATVGNTRPCRPKSFHANARPCEGTRTPSAPARNCACKQAMLAHKASLVAEALASGYALGTASAEPEAAVVTPSKGGSPSRSAGALASGPTSGWPPPRAAACLRSLSKRPWARTRGLAVPSEPCAVARARARSASASAPPAEAVVRTRARARSASSLQKPLGRLLRASSETRAAASAVARATSTSAGEGAAAEGAASQSSRTSLKRCCA
mmetsp:Transcript_170512/g.541677  ORF Transcript_170512/g.541677 Transcript_170512/m.541677 type:complete len:323 (-) Transcript_170512:311-1279(-)